MDSIYGPTRQLACRVRIAVSVFFGLATVALCVLWVRSYWRLDWIEAQRRGVYVNASSLNGGICLGIEDGESSFRLLETHSLRIGDQKVRHIPDRTLTFAWFAQEQTDLWYVPHWFFATIAAATSVGTAIGGNARFSLRTLLLATTVVGILLGTIGWAAR